MPNIKLTRKGLKTNFKKTQLFQKTKLVFDLGSHFTRVIINDHLVFNQPSCYLTDQTQESVLAIGDKAWAIFGQEPANTSTVFPMHKGVVYDQKQFRQLVQALWQQFKQDLNLAWFSRLEVMYSLPESATQLDKKIIKQCLAEVGFSSVQFVPKAQALLAQLGQTQPNSVASGQILILDIGDQLTELVVGSRGFTNFARTIDIGSQQISLAIQKCLQQKHNLLVSYQQASKMKHHLQYDFSGESARTTAQNYQLTAESKINIRGIDTQDHLVMTKTIQAADLMQSIVHELKKLSHAIKRTLSLIQSEQLISGLNNGIILTGGGSQLLGLDDFLAQELQANVMSSTEPLTDLVSGTLLIK